MLNKDLLRYNTRNGEIKPKFIKTDDLLLLSLAENLLKLYDTDMSHTRGELEEVVNPIISSNKDLKLAKGLNKLILDKCEFTTASNVDYTQLRRDIFADTNKLLTDLSVVSFQDYNNRVVELFNSLSHNEQCDLSYVITQSEQEPLPEVDLYGDLPSNEQLNSVKKMHPKELLERYNISLVQSLLLYSKHLTVTLEDPDQARIRTFFRYLRFFRLLADIKKTESDHSGMPRKVVLEISGPLSLFENTKKYSLQLASFFPVICLMKKWRIETYVKVNSKELKLNVSDRSGLVSYYRDTSYIPEEVGLFAKLFREKVSNWEMIDNPTFLDLGMQNIIFPDQSFVNVDGRIIYLELFHRWHSGQLMTRLNDLETDPNIPLIIGVDRAIYNKKEFKSIIDNSELFSDRGFLFRDFPVVDRVRKCLDHFSNKLSDL